MMGRGGKLCLIRVTTHHLHHSSSAHTATAAKVSRRRARRSVNLRAAKLMARSGWQRERLFCLVCDMDSLRRLKFAAGLVAAAKLKTFSIGDTFC
jgi:hypothetical protein